jgi:hypothetical protein
MPHGAKARILESEDATTQETKYELVLKAIAALKLNDETPHIQKLELCIALARSVHEPLLRHGSGFKPCDGSGCGIRN